MNNLDNTRAAVIPVALAPATADDVPDLIKVHAAAFRSDLFSILMVLNRPQDEHQAPMQKSIDYWLADPHTQIIKAVDGDGQVVGWTCWVLKGATNAQPSKVEKADSSSAKKEVNKTEAETTEKSPPKTAEAPSPKGTTRSGVQVLRQQSTTEDPARVLGRLMREEMVRWEEDKRLKGKKYMVLQALATDPSCQCRGIGTQLVQWGADKADAEGLPCWAHASPASHTLYAKTGFEELGRSDFNLAEWAPGGGRGNRGWGTYTFRYMLRPAKNLI